MHKRYKILFLLFLILDTVVFVNSGNTQESPLGNRATSRSHRDSASSPLFFMPLAALMQFRKDKERDIHYPDVTEETEESMSAADATADGAIHLPAKSYQFGSTTFTLLPHLSLSLPTAETVGFLEFEEATVSPFFDLSLERGRLEVHTSSGIEVNLDKGNHSRFHYTGGVTLQATQRFSFFLDAMRSVPLNGGRGGRTWLNTSLIDLEAGFQIDLSESAIGFLTTSAFLADDRLQSGTVTLGLEISF